ncbi:hypothetical protein E4T38_06378 [Aureobasidium subglaciale]|nr:hypothetical protein E4T38_06378 [Aureobasidium subglaciale]KAI5219495.1 hypothetical protein E4T40_06370 [Aureobasidium subglaciale]KAI5223209.1 hypothetical protein E4T41_06210 [Aureobasidium subglaciale]KAI5259745.1 hypothetical protein E4T46_06645 [Aureobasidium subglaciale]
MSSIYECSPLDSVIPALFNAMILGFPFRDRPYLTGEVAPAARGLALRVPSGEPEMELLLNDMTAPGHAWQYSYEELQKMGMPLSLMDPRLLAPEAGYMTSMRVMAARANFIPGGCLLTVYFQHAFMDAFGSALVTGVWAENCRKLQEAERSVASSSPLASLEAPKELEMPPALRWENIEASEIAYQELKTRPELWKTLSLDWRNHSVAAPFSNHDKMVTALFRISSADLIDLKNTASLKLPKSSEISAPQFLSTADSLGGLLWRTIMRARYPPEKQPPVRESIINVAMDGRRGLGLPSNYPGNVIFASMTEKNVDWLTSPSTTVGDVAFELRKSLTANKRSQNLSDALRLVASIRDHSSLKFAIPDWSHEDLILTSWIELPFYEHVWGPEFGETQKAEFFRMPKGQFEGICSVQPRRPGGSVEVIVGLEPEQMEAFKNDPEVLEYLSFVSS